jgi:hypothetical protein
MPAAPVPPAAFNRFASASVVSRATFVPVRVAQLAFPALISIARTCPRVASRCFGDKSPAPPLHTVLREYRRRRCGTSATISDRSSSSPSESRVNSRIIDTPSGKSRYCPNTSSPTIGLPFRNFLRLLRLRPSNCTSSSNSIPSPHATPTSRPSPHRPARRDPSPVPPAPSRIFNRCPRNVVSPRPRQKAPRPVVNHLAPAARRPVNPVFRFRIGASVAANHPAVRAQSSPLPAPPASPPAIRAQRRQPRPQLHRRLFRADLRLRLQQHVARVQTRVDHHRRHARPRLPARSPTESAPPRDTSAAAKHAR